jgi:hypothetical protein
LELRAGVVMWWVWRFGSGQRRRRRSRRSVFTKCMFVQCCLVCTPVPHLPLLFQGVSASDLPTKAISLIPTKDPGTNLFDCSGLRSTPERDENCPRIEIESRRSRRLRQEDTTTRYRNLQTKTNEIWHCVRCSCATLLHFVLVF